MNVLVLYGFRDLRLARNTSLNHLFCYKRYAPEHNYLYHCGHHPVTAAMQAIDFSVVILDTSFFSQRTSRPRSIFDEFRDRWSWLADIRAAKIALPQDEYDHCAILDDWIHDLKVDTVYSVLGHREVLYPRSMGTAEFVHALTGYIDEEEAARFRAHAGPLRERTIDVGYRGRDLEFQYGRLGRLKAQIHHQFSAALANTDLKIDSMIAPDAAILGDDWVRFLCNSQFTPAGPSGVSMWDPRGEIRDRTEAYLLANPKASFEETEGACFPGLDERYLFTAISPRLFEATAAGACQILVDGTDYVGLRPDEHYIQLRADFSDLKDVVERLRDLKAAQAMADRAYDTLFNTEVFRYRHFARELLDRACGIARSRGAYTAGDARFQALVAAHQQEVQKANEPAPTRHAGGSGAGPTQPQVAAASMLDRAIHLVRKLTPRPIRHALKRIILPRVAR